MTEPRYMLHAYVCGHGCVRLSQHEGWMTFSRVFIERPDDCRYAVATTEPPPKVVVWDLYDHDLLKRVAKRLGQPLAPLLAPAPIREHDDLDAAVMAAQLLYDHDDD